MCYSFSFVFKFLVFLFVFNDIVHGMWTWYIKAVLINLLHLLKRSSFMHFSETDQIYSRADCKNSNGRILLSQVLNKILNISASFELWYVIVAILVLELLKNKIRPVSKNHPVFSLNLLHRLLFLQPSANWVF